MRVSIKDIAKIAGVHRSTVDKVLHNRVGVSNEVRERVRKIIEELDYEPNPIGKALKRQEKRIVIAAVLLDVDALSSIKEGIEKAFGQYKGFNSEIHYYVHGYSDIEGQISTLINLSEENVDGIIINPINAPQIRLAVNKIIESGIPVITSNFDIKDSKRVCFVGHDAEKAGRVAGRLMGEFLGGKGKIAIITNKFEGDRIVPTANRVYGFKQLIEKEFPFIEAVANIESFEDPKVIYKKTITLLTNEPDLKGLYITCGGVSEVAKAVRKMKKAEEIKIICFERYPDILELLKENIVTCSIDSNVEEQGYRPCRLMMDYLLYDKKITQDHLYMGINILLKESL